MSDFKGKAMIIDNYFLNLFSSKNIKTLIL